VNRSEVEAPFGSPGDPNNLDSDSDGLASEVVGGGRASPSASPSASLSQAPNSHRIATTIPRPQSECAREGEVAIRLLVAEARVQREAIQSLLVTDVTVMTDVRVSRSG
jgi:hypothetical protein